MLDVQEALGNTTALPAIVWGLRVNRRIPALWRRQDGSWHMVERTGERDLTADEAAPFETAVGKVFL